MAKKKSAQFKRFENAMGRIVRVSKDELAKRDHADRARRAAQKPSRTAPSTSPAAPTADSGD